MGTLALILMISVQITVTLITAYFFYKVLSAPMDEGEHTSMPDPISDNPNHESTID